jgi:hypothetical protein
LRAGILRPDYLYVALQRIVAVRSLPSAASQPEGADYLLDALHPISHLLHVALQHVEHQNALHFDVKGAPCICLLWPLPLATSKCFAF